MKVRIWRDDDPNDAEEVEFGVPDSGELDEDSEVVRYAALAALDHLGWSLGQPESAGDGEEDMMGQYHKLVNLTKREFVHPHALGDGLKVREQMSSGPGGVGSALIALLACPEPRGGGDVEVDPEAAYGRWHGDRVLLVGDYAEDSDLPHIEPDGEGLSKVYERCTSEVNEEIAEALRFRDVTPNVRELLASQLDLEYRGDRGWLNRVSKGALPNSTQTAMRPDVMVVTTKD
jgi:hypothetical protein